MATYCTYNISGVPSDTIGSSGAEFVQKLNLAGTDFFLYFSPSSLSSALPAASAAKEASPSTPEAPQVHPPYFTAEDRALLQQRSAATVAAMKPFMEKKYVDRCKRWLHAFVTWACHDSSAKAWAISENGGSVDIKLVDFADAHLKQDSPEALLLQKVAAAALNEELAEFGMHLEIAEALQSDGRHALLISRPAT